MKRGIIDSMLAHYHQNKGYFRTLLRAEPNVKRLEEFLKTISSTVSSSEDNFFPAHLLEIAKITLLKNAGDDLKKNTFNSESAKLFDSIAKLLGGFSFLEGLNTSGLLTEEVLVFSERYPEAAIAFLPVIQAFSEPGNESDTIILSGLFQLPLSSEEFIRIAACLNQADEKKNTALILIKLYDYNQIEKDELLEHILPFLELPVTDVIYTLMERNEPLVITNLKTILKLRNPQEFLKLLTYFEPLTQGVLDLLFSKKDCLYPSSHAERLIKTLQENSYPLLPFLFPILEPNTNNEMLSRAVHRLTDLSKRIPLDTEMKEFILHHFFKHSNESIILAQAAETLATAGLQGDMFKNEFSLAAVSPKFSDKLALAFLELIKNSANSPQHRQMLVGNPQFARGVAKLIIQIKYLEITSDIISKIYKDIKKHPESAEKKAEVIQYLRDNEMDFLANIVTVTRQEMPEKEFIDLLEILKPEGLLNQRNINSLLSNTAQIPSLLVAVRSLSRQGCLNQENIFKLFKKPEQAKNTAGTLIQQKSGEEVKKEAPDEASVLSRRGFFKGLQKPLQGDGAARRFSMMSS